MKLVVLGCGFAAKYPEGGGNFSVPLQYVLGLRRMQRRFLWLEVMESTGNPSTDTLRAATFRRRLKGFGLENDYSLLVFPKGEKNHDLANARCFGKSRREVRNLLHGAVLLNLSASVHTPLLQTFANRKLCSLDPTEVCFWMQRMEMGQSYHDEFWTIGLNMGNVTSRVPKTNLKWQTYFPFVDTSLFAPAPRPAADRFTTIGQWYWDGMIEFDGVWQDFSKRAAFEKFLRLPRLVSDVTFELAMNLNETDPERSRLRDLGWEHEVPHIIARTPRRYYDYVRQSTAEFSAVKLESHMLSGWLSDRSAVYLALGRPVITEPTGAESFLPAESGLIFVNDEASALDAVQRVRKDWTSLSNAARACAVECFDAVVNLKKILG